MFMLNEAIFHYLVDTQIRINENCHFLKKTNIIHFMQPIEFNIKNIKHNKRKDGILSIVHVLTRGRGNDYTKRN